MYKSICIYKYVCIYGFIYSLSPLRTPPVGKLGEERRLRGLGLTTVDAALRKEL